MPNWLQASRRSCKLPFQYFQTELKLSIQDLRTIYLSARKPHSNQIVTSRILCFHRALCRALAAIALLAQYSRAQTTPEVARSLQDHLEYVAYSEITRSADPEEKREASEKFLDRHKGSRYQSAVEDLYLHGLQLPPA